MDFDEAMLATVSRVEATYELEAHGRTFAEFASEVGEREEYKGSEILEWLGY